jgi:hypothetical protein
MHTLSSVTAQRGGREKLVEKGGERGEKREEMEAGRETGRSGMRELRERETE